MVKSLDGRYLYALSETNEYNGNVDGSITVFEILDNYHLKELQTISSCGAGPAYVNLDRSGKYLLLTNFVAGNVVVYPIGENGKLTPPSDMHMHEGSSINPLQTSPRPHSIITSFDNKFVYIPDLGIDKIKTYSFDEKNGTLTPRPDLDVKLAPGTEPRHITFSSAGDYAYITTQMTHKVIAYRYEDGALRLVEEYNMIPEEFTSFATGSEIKIAPNGRHLYGGTRVYNSISVFAIDQNNGKLERTQIISSEGNSPRHFAIDPSGKILIVGNMRSFNLVSYFIDPENGELTPTGYEAKAPTPVMIDFIR